MNSLIKELHSITTLNEISLVKRNFNFALNTEIDITKFSYAVKVEDHLVLKDDTIIKEVFINLSDQQSNLMAELQVIFYFHVRMLFEKYAIKDKSGEYLINSDLSELLNHIVLATSRGIMFSEFRGTLIGKALLPLINPDDLKHS